MGSHQTGPGKFFLYLVEEKGLKEETAAGKTNRSAFFIMKYVIFYEDYLDSILEIDGEAIRVFLGNWYIRKEFMLKLQDINDFLNALADFYRLLYRENLLDKEEWEDIKEVCRDKKWFKMRLETYFSSDGDEFDRWLEDYNYGF